MIVGVGIDTVNKKRIEESITKFGDSFPSKILSSKELEVARGHVDKIQYVSSRFSAKEAVYKAVNKICKITWHDISVLNDREGMPYVNFENGEVARLLNGYKLHLSISHDNVSITTLCIVERGADS